MEIITIVTHQLQHKHIAKSNKTLFIIIITRVVDGFAKNFQVGKTQKGHEKWAWNFWKFTVGTIQYPRLWDVPLQDS